MDEAERTPPARAVEVRGLTKAFNNSLVLRGINLEIYQGESLVVLGPNGAGKTTLLKILATIMRPTSGEVIINGRHHRRQAEEIRRQVGVVAHETFLYSNLTAHDNLAFYSRLYAVPHPEERLQEVVELVGLTPRLYQRVGTLSRGMQQRLSLARSLLHRPSVMLLDEPETGLDQQALPMLWEVMRGEGTEKRTVIITTHNLELGLDIGDRVIVLHQGRVVYQQPGHSRDLTGLRRAYEEYTAVKP